MLLALAVTPAGALSFVDLARQLFGLQDLITTRHLENMCKIMLGTGLIVAYAYIMETFMACLNPAAMERTPTSTATTPAMPMAAAATAPRRWGMLMSPNFVIEAICRSQLTGPLMKG